MVADFAQRVQRPTHQTTEPTLLPQTLGDLGRSLSEHLAALEQKLGQSPSHKALFSQLENLLQTQVEMVQNLLDGAAPQGLAATCNHAAQQLKAMASGKTVPRTAPTTAPSSKTGSAKVSSKVSTKVSTKVTNPNASKGQLTDTDIKSIVTFGQTSPQKTSHPLANVLDFRRRATSDSPSAPSWDDQITAFGQEVKAIREAQGLSQVQLHMRSLVPIYHLRALEDGNLDELPEPIFVQGFLNRLCKALGEDGQTLAKHCPQAPLTRDALASWQRPGGTTTSPGLRPYHLYAGYATLVAGAFGGLTAIQQSDLPGAAQAITLDSNQSIAMKTPQKASPTQKAQLQKPTIGTDLAPPEQTSPEKSKI